MSMKQQKHTAVYFGTFNPVHFGHLRIAQAVVENELAHQVAFVPTGTPPHRMDDPSLIAGRHRYALLQRATSNHPRFTVWPDEALSTAQLRNEGQPQYTIDTLRNRFPEVFCDTSASQRIPFILGEDNFLSLGTWKDFKTLIQACHFLLARRQQNDGSPLATLIIPENLQSAALQVTELPLPLLPYSATELRQLAAQGKSLRYQTPDAVSEYIHWNQLYTPTSCK